MSDQESPDLNAVMAEFDREVGTLERNSENPNHSDPDDKPSAQSADSLDHLKQRNEELSGHLGSALEHIEAERKSREEAELNRQISAAVSIATEGLSDLPSPPPERAVRGLLYERYWSNDAFAQAFLKSREDPKGWERALNKAIKELRNDDAFHIDHKVTRDREAVAAAVQGARTAEPSKPEFSQRELSNMSHTEFERQKREVSRSVRS